MEALKTLEDKLQAQDIKEVKPDKGVKIAQKSTGESIARTIVALELSSEVCLRQKRKVHGIFLVCASELYHRVDAQVAEKSTGVL